MITVSTRGMELYARIECDLAAINRVTNAGQGTNAVLDGIWRAYSQFLAETRDYLMPGYRYVRGAITCNINRDNPHTNRCECSMECRVQRAEGPARDIIGWSGVTGEQDSPLLHVRLTFSEQAIMNLPGASSTLAAASALNLWDAPALLADIMELAFTQPPPPNYRYHPQGARMVHDFDTQTWRLEMPMVRDQYEMIDGRVVSMTAPREGDVAIDGEGMPVLTEHELRLARDVAGLRERVENLAEAMKLYEKEIERINREVAEKAKQMAESNDPACVLERVKEILNVSFKGSFTNCRGDVEQTLYKIVEMVKELRSLADSRANIINKNGEVIKELETTVARLKASHAILEEKLNTLRGLSAPPPPSEEPTIRRPRIEIDG